MSSDVYFTYQMERVNENIIFPDLSQCFHDKCTFISNRILSVTGKTFYEELVNKDGSFKNEKFDDTGTLRCDYYDGDIYFLSGDKLILNEDTPLFFDGDDPYSICRTQLS